MNVFDLKKSLRYVIGIHNRYKTDTKKKRTTKPTTNSQAQYILLKSKLDIARTL